MRVTFIYPNLGRRAYGPYVDEGRMEPLTLGLLAGLTPPDVEVALYDERVETIPFDEAADLVAITVHIFNARRAYEISAAFRQRGVKVILGGVHSTLLPEEAARHADAVFIGDAEPLWAQVIEDTRHGRLQPVYRSRPAPPQPQCFPRRDLYRGKGYLPLTLMQFSRGCRFPCSFCSTSVYFGRQHFYRDVRRVVEEIEAQERKSIFFVDDNLLADFDAAKALFRALIPLKIHWVSQASIDMTGDRELMTLMAKSGCLGHVIGFESLDPDNLRAMQKTPGLAAGGLAGYGPQLEILRDYGLQTWAAFTLGHDHDTPETIRQTLDFALEHKFTFAAFNVLMPYPNTPLYRRLAAEGRLLYDGRWWLHPEYRFNYAAFRPKLLTPDELTAGGFHCRATFNNFPNLVRRMFDFKTNLGSLYRLGIYLVYNRLFRQETFKKHGMRFGVES